MLVKRKKSKCFICWSANWHSSTIFCSFPLILKRFHHLSRFYILPLHYVFKLNRQKQNDFERDDGFIKTSSFLQSLLKTCCKEQDRNAGTKSHFRSSSLITNIHQQIDLPYHKVNCQCFPFCFRSNLYSLILQLFCVVLSTMIHIYFMFISCLFQTDWTLISIKIIIFIHGSGFFQRIWRILD